MSYPDYHRSVIGMLAEAGYDECTCITLGHKHNQLIAHHHHSNTAIPNCVRQIVIANWKDTNTLSVVRNDDEYR